MLPAPIKLTKEDLSGKIQLSLDGEGKYSKRQIVLEIVKKFPIDSAFKRRWDWQYVPISDAGKNWVVRVNGSDYSWCNFLEKINQRIYKATYSEDKKLGYFFCKADNDGVIDADKFVSKVVFYLWNDVFKDMEFEGDAFKDGENGKLSFDKFYKVEAGKTKVVSDKVELFLKNLGLEPVAASSEDDSEE